LLTSIDMLLFSLCVVTCIQTSDIEVFDPGNEGPVPRTDVSGVGRYCVLN